MLLGLSAVGARGLAAAGPAAALGPIVSYTLTATPVSVTAGGTVAVKIQAVDLTGSASTTDTPTVAITSTDAR